MKGLVLTVILSLFLCFIGLAQGPAPGPGGELRDGLTVTAPSTAVRLTYGDYFCFTDKATKTGFHAEFPVSAAISAQASQDGWSLVSFRTWRGTGVAFEDPTAQSTVAQVTAACAPSISASGDFTHVSNSGPDVESTGVSWAAIVGGALTLTQKQGWGVHTYERDAGATGPVYLQFFGWSHSDEHVPTMLQAPKDTALARLEHLQPKWTGWAFAVNGPAAISTTQELSDYEALYTATGPIGKGEITPRVLFNFNGSLHGRTITGSNIEDCTQQQPEVVRKMATATAHEPTALLIHFQYAVNPVSVAGSPYFLRMVGRQLRCQHDMPMPGVWMQEVWPTKPSWLLVNGAGVPGVIARHWTTEFEKSFQPPFISSPELYQAPDGWFGWDYYGFVLDPLPFSGTETHTQKFYAGRKNADPSYGRGRFVKSYTITFSSSPPGVSVGGGP